MEAPSPLLLEIDKQGNVLKMCVSDRAPLALSVKQFSQCAGDLQAVRSVCDDIRLLLQKSRSKASLHADLLSSLKKSGRVLWEQLLTRQVRNKLKNSSERDLILCLDEELIGIPWELLYDGEQFLSLRFNCGRVVQTRQESVPQYRSVHSRLKMLVVANPTDDLPSAYREGVNIRDQFDRLRSVLSIDFKSTRVDTLYIRKNMHEYDIVHFAGHCEYDPDDPSATGWVFSDGRLSVQDIQLMGQSQPLPSLVFSNACHSAQAEDGLSGSEQGNFSLASAFLFSGVRHYIGTVNRVEDEVSLCLAKEFYHGILKGYPVGRSLRQARFKVAERFGMQSLVWAHQVLYGDPGFVLFRPLAQGASRKLSSLRESLRKRRKTVFLASGSLLLITALAVSAWYFLPTLDPSSFFLFRKAQAALRSGGHEEVISLSKEIIRRDAGFLPVYPLLAETYARTGDRQKALSLYFEYAVKSQEANEIKELAAAYTMIGWLYHQMGDYPKAYEFYEQARTTSVAHRDMLGEAAVMRKLAVWHMDKGDNEMALRLLTKSSEINRERASDSRHRYNLACDYFDLGLVFANKDDFEQARKFYVKSKELFENMRLSHEISDYYFNLGELCLFEKQYQKALAYYLQGAAIDQRQGNLVSLASDYTMIGELYSEMGTEEKAEEYFKRSIEISSKIDARPERAAACFDLGLLYKKKNRMHQAREFLRQAQEIYRTIDTPEQESVKKEILSLEGSF